MCIEVQVLSCFILHDGSVMVAFFPQFECSKVGCEVLRDCAALVRHISTAKGDERRNGLVVDADASHLPGRSVKPERE